MTCIEYTVQKKHTYIHTVQLGTIKLTLTGSSSSSKSATNNNNASTTEGGGGEGDEPAVPSTPKSTPKTSGTTASIAGTPASGSVVDGGKSEGAGVSPSSSRKKKAALTYQEMVAETIVEQGDKRGSSLAAIKSGVAKAHPAAADTKQFVSRINRALKLGVSSKQLIKVGARWKVNVKLIKEKQKAVERAAKEKVRNDA
jgi:hypothetical protein